LIYKVRLAGGTSAVIRINRLKRAHKQVEDGILPTSMNINKAVEPKKFMKSISKEREYLIDVEKLDTEIRSHPQVLDVVGTSSEDFDEDAWK
jgi:hypothetical protein